MNNFAGGWRRALALKWLWLLHAHPFHWAHKPLCARFRQDVVRIGHVHLCRSCLLAYIGIAVGITASIWSPLWLQVHGLFVFTLLATTTVLLSLPLWYKRWPRPVRDVLRFSMGLSIILCGYVLCNGHVFIGTLGVVGLFAFWKLYLSLRRQRRLASCSGCPELATASICSGYLQQAEHLRRYEQQATEWVMANERPFLAEAVEHPGD